MPQLDPKVEHFIRNGVANLYESASFIRLPKGFMRTKLKEILQENAWGHNIFVTKDFTMVIKNEAGTNEDEYIRPVWWIVSAGGQSSAEKLLIISPYEANAYISIFRQVSTATTLHMFAPRLSASQSSLMDIRHLQLPPTTNTSIGYLLKAEISLFAGSLYFENADEQSAYCEFMGLIPRPRTDKHEEAFENGLITVIGFVPKENRHISMGIQANCKFDICPDKLAIQIINRRTLFLPRESHVSLIITEAKKSFCDSSIEVK